MEGLNMNEISCSKPHKLSFQYLKEITDKFSDKQELGKGGFGVVYKGVRENGEIIAVKKLLHFTPSSQEQFENEVHLLMELEHPNIVRLVGYSYEIQNEYVTHEGKGVFAEEINSLLCLEYFPKGSLEKYLSDESSRLGWHSRYKIIEGICAGLQYLHEQANGPIIHLDLKPSNILLDDNMTPKITDFGLSRLLDREETICTLSISGTLGYMPPEYLQGIITPMSDIFSLGVVILEIITGHRDYPNNTTSSLFEDFIKLELQKWRNVLEGEPGCQSLETDCQQIKRCIQIALTCLNPKRAERPTITKIIKMLNGLETFDCNVINEVEKQYQSLLTRLKQIVYTSISKLVWGSQLLQITSGPREFLGVYPLGLLFRLAPNSVKPCFLRLTNKTDQCIAFHLKVERATNSYCIEPNDGFMLPRSTQNVVVTMKEQHGYPSDMQYRIDKFLVQSIIVRKERVTSMHLTQDTFNNMPSNMVHHMKLGLQVIVEPQVSLQKIVIKVPNPCKKIVRKALAVVSQTSGLKSIKITGVEEDKLEVIGDGVDAVKLVHALGKKCGGDYQIVSVEPC